MSFTLYEDDYKRRWGDKHEGPFVFESRSDAFEFDEERQKIWLRDDRDIDIKAIEAKYQATQDKVEILEDVEEPMSKAQKQEYEDLNNSLESWNDVV